jgi:hypothetical protein
LQYRALKHAADLECIVSNMESSDDGLTRTKVQGMAAQRAHP